MKFNHKILLLPLVTALAFALIFLLLDRTARQSGRTIARVQDEFFHALELSHRLQVDIMSIRHLLTNAVSSGNEDDVDEAARLAGTVRATLADCEDVPLLADRLAGLRGSFDAYWQLAWSTTGELVARGAELQLDFDADLLRRVGLMNRHYEDLRGQLAAVVAASNLALDGAMQETRASIARTRRRMNVVSLVFVALLVGMSLAAIGAIIRPVHRMSRVARAIAGGDLHQQLDFRSRDALGELADAFREMQAALVDDIARRERAESELIAAQGRVIQSEKSAALGKLVAGLAHEMNSPLGVLTSAADTVDRSRRTVAARCGGAGAGDDPRLARALTALERGVAALGRAAGRIDELVAGLRSFSQLDQAAFRRLDVNDAVRTTLEVLRHEVPAGVVLRAEAGEVPPLPGYPAQLNQLLVTLLRRAAGDVAGGGEVVVTTAPDGDGGVVITVADDGRGHDARELRALFDPGFRSDRRRVRLDWGLVACAGIAARHGGSLDAASVPGRGTTITVRLPRDGAVGS